ncbi:hypothetical protein PPL_02626 [Heterostelium album PN500]|uniref:Uncharacterized protein n=1 Tax=Heterostelium pallidum (strain ATCC 26659 / Pp 5 / PN500) TaxID=670386 RepID=D3B2L2_HETP5|nr:hypothetical protein PPL_02626 [Heterostelium album PN500]EFA83560.1 hypothetical protein PPL_02626 [Heterostelium album PN500]|eukprot:XP_020435677.1 hypothetical protein PPL_02626 [Heterostelium album PN500]
MTVIVTPVEIEIIPNTLKLNHTSNLNRMSLSFDINLDCHPGFVGKEFNISVWLKRNQLVEKESIFNRDMISEKGVKTITISLVDVQFSDESMFKIISSMEYQYIATGVKYDGQLTFRMVVEDGILGLENPYEGKHSIGHCYYRYDDDGFWDALNTYSIESLCWYFYEERYRYFNLGEQRFSLKKNPKPPTIEQFADIVCFKASKSFNDQDNIGYNLELGSKDFKNFNQIGYNTHELLEIIKLGYQHFLDLNPIEKGNQDPLGQREYSLNMDQFTIYF